jgi:hypothetical protein
LVRLGQIRSQWEGYLETAATDQTEQSPAVIFSGYVLSKDLACVFINNISTLLCPPNYFLPGATESAPGLGITNHHILLLLLLFRTVHFLTGANWSKSHQSSSSFSSSSLSSPDDFAQIIKMVNQNRARHAETNMLLLKFAIIVCFFLV